MSCIDDISHWMNVNRLKLNKKKTTFILLGAPHQLSQIDRRKIQLGETEIAIASEAMCLGVLLDSTLTFAPHVRRLAGRCFYHLRQLRTVRRSWTADAAKTMTFCIAYSFVINRIDYTIKPGFHPNAIACVGKQPIMVATASSIQ